jgi:para-nitrobenzyl esterase
MLSFLLAVLTTVHCAPTLDEVLTQERSALEADVLAHNLPTALSNHAIRKAKRFQSNLESGVFTLGPTIHTIYGDITGVQSGNVTQYLGVPFAAPPTGPLRWKAPAKPSNWGSKNATWFGFTCPQTEADTWAIFTGTSEDCLNMNIYAPLAPPPPGGYPILLFWYGGSFTYGSAGFPLYDGFFDVSLTQNTIVVAANYRLGVLGYLAGDALKADSVDGSVGTYGHQDQRMSLQFIQDTASAFGGNPKKVTIFGQSAGAASVSAHLINPKSWGLFSGGIIESGSFSPWTAQPYNISQTRFNQFAKNVGCAGAGSGSGSDVLACLRTVNVSQVLKGDHDLTSAFLEWSPAIDGVEILDDPRVLLEAGKVADVPVMLGFNQDEGTMFVRAPKDLNASGYVAEIASVLPGPLSSVVAAEYPCSDFTSDLGQSNCWWGIAQVERDFAFAYPVVHTATTLSTLPSRASSNQVFAYYYTHVLFIVDIVDIFKPYRCFHGSELPAVFNLWPTLWGEGEAAMGQFFTDAWATFAATGNPGVPKWQTWGTTNGTLVIDTGLGGVNISMAYNHLQEKNTFWANHFVPESVIWG